MHLPELLETPKATKATTQKRKALSVNAAKAEKTSWMA